MKKPLMAQLKLANPDFFDPVWDRLFWGATILPGVNGGWELVVDGRYSRPVYTIEPETFNLVFARNEI